MKSDVWTLVIVWNCLAMDILWGWTYEVITDDFERLLLKSMVIHLQVNND